jgi:DNA-directed RNA polymerase
MEITTMSEERQLEQEKESVTLGALKYEKSLKYHDRNNTLDQTAPARQLMRHAIDEVSEAIELDRNRKRRGRGRTYLPLVETIESDVLAAHALRALLAKLVQLPTHTAVCATLGKALVEELNWRKFYDQDRVHHDTTQTISKKSTGYRRVRAMRKMFSRAHITPVTWTNEEQVRVGHWLIEIVIAVTGWGVFGKRRVGKNKTERVINPTQDFLSWVEDAHTQLASLNPVRLPMVCKPLPWTSPTEGGYLTDLGGEVSIVKSYNRGYLESLEQVDMPEVYEALNAIQDTPWEINEFVLDVAQKMWEEGIAVGPRGSESMPSRRPFEVSAFPAQWEGKVDEWKKEDEEGYRRWCKRAAQVHRENARLFSKRLSCGTKLSLAERYRGDTIYFPHQMDFRGRVYPIPAHLNPQGDDLAKALLQFAQGKPLTADGVPWLMVHVANCFGVDKVSFEERIAWTETHLEALIDSGFDPVDGERFWMTADDPFLALAACRELAGWSIAGDNYVSKIPISMDGSCNGLQNFSAMLKDEVGGRATNLVPLDKPADVYQEVADIVAKKIRAKAEAGEPEAIGLDGYISRSLVKQPVMTQPYGATIAGMRQQLLDALRKSDLLETVVGSQRSWHVGGYLGFIVHESIGEVVIAARQAMDWLQETAQIVASEEYPLRWTTPVGLPVLQEYKRFDAKRMIIYIQGQRSEMYTRIEGKKLDRNRMRQGISPNLIHSFDAAHMMKTTNLAKANGIESFAMIHDSFGTHACDTPLLHQCIRESFVEMYRPNLLAQFKEQLESQIPEDIELPELPPEGTLDLDQVKESRYFFA